MYRGKAKVSETKKSVFITGCNRGIGLGLVREFLKKDEMSVIIAGTRSFEKAEELLNVSNDPRLHFVEIDIAKEEMIRAAVEKAEGLLGDAGLDLLINNAGVCFPLNVNVPIDRELARANYDVNVTGTLSNFKSLLMKAVRAKGRAQIVNISSIMASMAHTFGPMEDRHMTAYSMSKASVNMMSRCLSIGWKNDNIGVTAISPGWVQTEMGGEGAEISVEECAQSLVKFSLALNDEHNGKYYNYDATPIDW